MNDAPGNPGPTEDSAIARSLPAIAAEDPRPRTEVWERRLSPEPWFAAWPAVLRDRILAAIVDAEHDMVAAALVDWQDETSSTLEPEWRWDPDRGHLYGTAADLELVPDIDDYLEAARDRIPPRHFEAGAALVWLADIVTGDQYPAPLRRRAFEIWKRYGDPDPHPLFARVTEWHRERADLLTDQIRAFAQGVYRSGARHPVVPALHEPLPQFDSVQDAFPAEVSAPEPETSPGIEAEPSAPRTQEGPVR